MKRTFLDRATPWMAIALALAPLPVGADVEIPAFAALGEAYEREVIPLLESHCLDCHDSASRKGELDLERFTVLEDVRQAPAVWQHVREQLRSGEMPPEDTKQLSTEERESLLAWIGDYLHAEALAGAGDPGPVVLRRMSNAEYTHTLRDLTGLPALDPAREFPVDSAAGEGFTNTGAAQAMSPALLEKYLEAAKQVSGHAMLLPDGFRFTEPISRADRADALVEEIRAFYATVLQSGRIDFGYRSEVGSVAPMSPAEGRLDLTPYFEALLNHRETLLQDARATEAIAVAEKINRHYLSSLGRMLAEPPGEEEALLGELRARWRETPAGKGADLAGWVRSWQDRLWKFNPVGHLGGYVFDWQEPVNPVSDRRELRMELAAEGPLTISMVAGTARDVPGGEGDAVRWCEPRLVRAGKTPVALRDVPVLSRAFESLRNVTFSQISEILEIAFRARAADADPGGKGSLAELANTAEVSVDLRSLELVCDHLGLSPSGEALIGEYLTLAKAGVGNQGSISGWGLEGEQDLTLLANRSDTLWRIPGEAPPHRIVVHPTPERWVGASWRSPFEGRVRLEAHVQDRHACGNGVGWRLEQRQGERRRAWRSGTVDPATAAVIAPVESVIVGVGDLISLIVDSRDGNHACDLTEIELVVSEIGGEGRRWSLGEDCADHLLEGNPHADRRGLPGIWHFHTGRFESGEAPAPIIPPGSILARWWETSDVEEAARLGEELERLLTKSDPHGDGIPEADRIVAANWTDPAGPLWSRLDPGAWASDREWLMTLAEDALDLETGVPGAHWVDDSDLVVRAPSVLRFDLPGGIFSGYEFVVVGELEAGSSESGEGGVQLDLVAGEAEAPVGLDPDLPVIVRRGSPAEERVLRAFDDFRGLFPAAMCYARVIPIDEVVTLVLYHREDENLLRLMLEESERARIDRLWDELFYVSQDAFRTEVALEQILEFATQDADPAKFAPMLEPVALHAEALRRRLDETAPLHVDALVRFASDAYRRPLGEDEERQLRELYHSLRSDELSHEEAFRLSLARVLTAPAFLYRHEEPGPGDEPGPVSPWEQATRLSYFLWSSLPDAELRQGAAAGDLSDPAGLTGQAKRMLEDDRSRRLAVEFACQWLHVRGFDAFDEKNERLYPEFADLRASMYEEVIWFFADLFQNNGSILSVLEADHTFVNGPLAAFYGLEDGGSGIAAGDWRRTEKLLAAGRGGILGMAAVLARHSGASRTSPILRGNWVYETLLGERLPRPPSDVPVLPETAPEGLSERGLIERHSADPACAKCHAKIDPYGFALEAFDTIGRSRTGPLANTRAVLVDGSEMEGLAGLRAHLVEERREDFVRHFCRKLLGYALGRGVLLSDEPLLDEMMSKLGADGYRFHSAVESVVLSRQFREIRGMGQETRGGGAASAAELEAEESLP